MSKIFTLTAYHFKEVFRVCKYHGFTPIQAIDKLLTICEIEHKNLDVKVLHPEGPNGRKETQYQFFYVDENNKEVNVLADKKGFRVTTNFYCVD